MPVETQGYFQASFGPQTLKIDAKRFEIPEHSSLFKCLSLKKIENLVMAQKFFERRKKLISKVLLQKSLSKHCRTANEFLWSKKQSILENLCKN